MDTDKIRAEFEAAFNLDEFRKMRRVLDGDKYQHDGTQSAWEGWCAALARRSAAPVGASLHSIAKRICERWDDAVPSEEISDEHRALRAALSAVEATKGQQDLTAEQIAAGAAVLGDDGKPIGRNTAIMVADAMRAAQPKDATDTEEKA